VKINKEDCGCQAANPLISGLLTLKKAALGFLHESAANTAIECHHFRR
jgi:hypothetical protein